MVGAIRGLRYALAEALERAAYPLDKATLVKPPRGANWELEAYRPGGSMLREMSRQPERSYRFRAKTKYGAGASDIYLGIRDEALGGFNDIGTALRTALRTAVTPPQLKADYERRDFGADLFKALIGRANDVTWSGSAGNANKRMRAKYGLEAMRNVADALEYDARKYKPKWYSFYGATSKHDKLYASLARRMRRSGYQMITPDGHTFFLRRMTPSMGQRVVSDLATVSPLAGLGYMATNALGE